MLSNPQAEGSGIGTVLIVEDEVLVSIMMEDSLLDRGVSEVIVCSTPDEAQAFIRRRSISCAILDVRIGGADSFGLADELMHRDLPFFFATAFGPEAIVERHRHRPILAKPFSNAQLLEFLHAAISEAQERDDRRPNATAMTKGGQLAPLLIADPIATAASGSERP